MSGPCSGKNKLVEDGINEEFFELLWSKDELNFGPSINIPDTIFYKYGQPTVWYFTAQNGKLKKKNRQNLMNARIEEVFNKHVLGYDVIATFINVSLEKDPKTGLYPPLTMEYLDREGLNRFLYKSQKENNGVLQRFIEPKGTKNEVVRAIWSPKVCLLERAENINNLHDTRFGLYERCVTYEGPEYFINSAPLRGPVLAGQLQKLCETVVSHISEVSFGQHQISRLVINFKVDSRDKIWLLYSTSIRTNDAAVGVMSSPKKVVKTLVNIEGVIGLPDTVNLNPNRSYDKAVNKNKVSCISCACETMVNMRHAITYKSVVKHYEHILHLVGEINGKSGGTVLNWPPDPEVVDAAGGVGFGCLKLVTIDDALSRVSRLELGKDEVHELRIPPIIRYLHPKLTAKSYVRCRLDPLFLYKTVSVCETCYLVYAEFTTMLLRLGQDLTKLLTPDPASHMLNESSTLTRPSSADWRNLSSVNRSMSQDSLTRHESFPSKNHLDAKNKAIGIRTSDNRKQPHVPRSIRKYDDVEPLRSQMSVDSFGTAPQFRMQESNSVAGLTNSTASLSSGLGRFDETATIQQMIAEREKHFFAEISRNPQLKDQHPLMHLISAQEKLKMIDEQSGVIMSKASMKKEGIFDQQYGKQSQDKYDKYGIYLEEQPYRIQGKLMKPSAWHKMRQKELHERALKKKMREQKSRMRKEAMMGSMADIKPEDKKVKVNPGNPNVVLDEDDGGELDFDNDEGLGGTTSSKKHAIFLRDTLSKIDAELDKASSPLRTKKGSITAPGSPTRPGTTSRPGTNTINEFPSQIVMTSTDEEEMKLLVQWGLSSSEGINLDAKYEVDSLHDSMMNRAK